MRLLSILSLCSIVLADMLNVPQPGRDSGKIASEILSSYPYVVSLQYKKVDGFQHICGGSILSPIHVLTAAQCEPPYDLLKLLHARAGSANNWSDGQVRKCNSFYSHSDFNRERLDYDFAIVTVNEPYRFNALVQPIRLATGPEPNSTSYLAVIGWGSNSDDKKSTTHLLGYVSLPVWSRYECNVNYNALSERQICTSGFPWDSKGACKGLIGSPAFQNGFQYGIVSSSYSCHVEDIPKIYASIVYLYRWIIEVSNY